MNLCVTIPGSLLPVRKAARTAEPFCGFRSRRYLLKALDLYVDALRRWAYVGSLLVCTAPMVWEDAWYGAAR